jgi:hypothetical protein
VPEDWLQGITNKFCKIITIGFGNMPYWDALLQTFFIVMAFWSGEKEGQPDRQRHPERKVGPVLHGLDKEISFVGSGWVNIDVDGSSPKRSVTLKGFRFPRDEEGYHSLWILL